MDRERDSFGGRIKRVAQVGAGLSSAAAAFGANRLLAGEQADAKTAKALAAALGNVKGPLMKVAQIIATIPDAAPPEYAEELAKLQANAPSMGWAFVKRRMRAELGADWREKFSAFEQEAAHAASLGQVHKATHLNGQPLACKLQYPDMASAVESDLSQLQVILGLFKRVQNAVDPSEMGDEIAARLREELDYEREAKAMRLYNAMLADQPAINTPEPIAELSTGRLLSMTWLEGRSLMSFLDAPLPVRNRIAELLFTAWWAPMTTYGVIHGDPHLGNYAVVGDGEALNLLDFGCIRIFPADFVGAVVALYRALLNDDREGQRAAYARWGFSELDDERMDVLNVWARFIYAPLLDDRVRTVADGVSPGEYGRKEAFRMRELLQEKGGVKVPGQFVFMDRAAIGLGAAFLHLGAELNFHQLFERSIAGFDQNALATRQSDALAAVGLSGESGA